jgi:hypothetical protein
MACYACLAPCTPPTASNHATGWATCVAYREPGTHEPIDQTCLVASMASHDEESIGASSMMAIDQLASGNGRDSRDESGA